MTKRITLESGFSASADGLKNVSLITTGIEASGHGIYLDEKTADGVMKKLLGRSVKSYLKHDGAGSDRIGQEIGFFSGIYRQGAQIKATAFEFLESFKKSAGDVAERIVEMAQKVPDQFGVSLVLEYVPVWVMADGSEVQASSDTAPAGTLRAMPSMRVLDIISADFVGRPAANPNGLLSVKTLVTVDAEADKQTSTQTTMSESATIVTLSVTDHEAKIAELSKANETAVAELAAKHADALKLESDKVSALTAALAAKDTEHKAALDKAVADATAPLSAKISELEVFDARKLGVAPIVLGKIVANEEAKKADLPAPAKTDSEKWEQYSALLDASPDKAAKFRAAHLSV